SRLTHPSGALVLFDTSFGSIFFLYFRVSPFSKILRESAINFHLFKERPLNLNALAIASTSDFSI
ncbi:MAG TPA: hypothetical protein VFW11_18710, partial [Cyclobacteriaceae bacterium]|nr:hypothetical protein [Cyclobacteriaceae bacterium]